MRRVIGVDHSREMLGVARRRLAGRDNVELREGDLEALPIDDAELDAALVALVLHHLADPAAVLAEAARVIRPGGRLLIVDMLPHDREVYRVEMGHAWLGAPLVAVPQTQARALNGVAWPARALVRAA